MQALGCTGFVFAIYTRVRGELQFGKSLYRLSLRVCGLHFRAAILEMSLREPG